MSPLAQLAKHHLNLTVRFQHTVLPKLCTGNAAAKTTPDAPNAKSLSSARKRTTTTRNVWRILVPQSLTMPLRLTMDNVAAKTTRARPSVQSPGLARSRWSDKSRNPHSSSPKDWPCPQSAIALSLEFGNRKDRRSIPGSPASRRNRRGPHWKDDSLVGNWRTSESGLVDSALIRSYGNERMASKSQCTAYCGEMLVFKDFHREGQ
jgi:hypothetical protein